MVCMVSDTKGEPLSYGLKSLKSKRPRGLEWSGLRAPGSAFLGHSQGSPGSSAPTQRRTIVGYRRAFTGSLILVGPGAVML